MRLPKIRRATVLRIKPGEALVLQLSVDILTAELADEVRQRVRAILNMPDLPVLVMDKGSNVLVVMNGEPA